MPERKLTSDEIKKIELNILLAFHVFCKEHELQYSLCGGSLLGAIRHKGFIPWDDDMDVWMPREDYDKLLLIDGGEIGDPYFLQTAYNFLPSPFIAL